LEKLTDEKESCQDSIEEGVKGSGSLTSNRYGPNKDEAFSSRNSTEEKISDYNKCVCDQSSTGMKTNSPSRVDKWLLSGRPPNYDGCDEGEGAKVLVLGEMDFTLALSLHNKWPKAEILATALFDASDYRAEKFEPSISALREGGQKVLFGVDATTLHENTEVAETNPKFTAVLFGFPRQGVPKQTAKARKKAKERSRKRARKLKRLEALEGFQNISFFDVFLNSLVKANLLIEGGILGLITLADHYDEWEVLASAEAAGFKEIMEVWEGIELNLSVDFPGYQPRKETGGKFDPYNGAILYLLRLSGRSPNINDLTGKDVVE